jgi:thiamine pyrophosphate-dependent acetolactate synthase large subunit-like protein
MGCVPADDPLTLGFIGRNGAYPANQAGRHADLVLCIGTRFDDRSSSSWHPGYSWNFPTTRLLQVDVDPQELGRNYPPTLGVIADAKVFCTQLLASLAQRAEIERGRWSAWRDEVAGWTAEWEAFVRPNFSCITTPIRPEYVVDAVQDVCPTTRSWRSIPASTTTGSCSSGNPVGPRACSTAGAIPRWASVSAACSARSWRRRSAPASRWSATAAS